MSCPKNCPNRRAEPNCHNVETCPIWAEHEENKAREYERRSKRFEFTGYVSDRVFKKGRYNK